MSRCIKIVVKVGSWKESWEKKIKKQAELLSVEGVLQSVGDSMFKIVACCKDDKLDDFIDYLYDVFDASDALVEELEPFIKKHDYRGVFRII